MAKKKNYNNIAPQKEPVNKATSENNMTSKVEVKQPENRSQERVSRIVGSAFIGLGVLLVAFGVYSFIRFREEPTIDANLESPMLEDVTSLTNGDRILIRGKASGYDNVFVYVNDEKVGNAKVDKDSAFEYEYMVTTQGNYTVDVAGVKGFPARNMSVRSVVKEATVDWTAPSADSVVVKYGPETNKETFIVVGTAEPSSKISLVRGVSNYEALADSAGNFKIENIPLDEGKNVFTLSIKDLAGNETSVDEKIRVTYSPTGTVNGDAAIDKDLPQAAGELDFLFGNQLMMVFALIALVGFSSSSAILYHKRK